MAHLGISVGSADLAQKFYGDLLGFTETWRGSQNGTVRRDYSRKFDIKTGVNRKRQCNLFDPDGTRVELMEPRTIDGKPTPPSTAPPPVR